jgi:hypothetical protein
MPTIRALKEGGTTSLRAIAKGLNEAGIPTARGCGEWFRRSGEERPSPGSL